MLALTVQLGSEAFSSQDMAATMDLCVSCKGCRRECPTGVDMARMKIEVKHALVKKDGLSPRDRLVGLLPKYAEIASRFHLRLGLQKRYSVFQQNALFRSGTLILSEHLKRQ